MALKATIFKAELQVSDMDRHYYESHTLTLARHPSETDERMMLRLLAFAFFADERLNFTRGISSVDEPDLWRKSLTDEIELWIELGQPDARRLAKACGRSQQVHVFCYGGRNADLWWQKIQADLERFDNLSIFNISDEAVKSLVQLVERNMHLQCMIQDGQIWVTSGEHAFEITPDRWQIASRS